MRGRVIIGDGIYMIAGPDISGCGDAASFIVVFGSELAMIDTGAGFTSPVLENNIIDFGLQPKDISTLILTHCHIDHIGSALYFRKNFACEIVAHELDADVIETGEPVRTAAKFYKTSVSPTPVDRRLNKDHEVLQFGEDCLHCLHTPGHTPGSLSVYLDRGGKRVLFGQDIHGPFNRYFRSDINQWKKSMEMLISLEADILCEGHYGIFEPKDKVERYIRRCLRNLS